MQKIINVYDRNELVYEGTIDHASRDLHYPHSVHLLHVVVPLPECVIASVGPVSEAIVDNLSIGGYDQVPVFIDGAEIDWRLVSRGRLAALSAAGETLSSDPSCLESRDIGQVEGVYADLITLLQLLAASRARILFARNFTRGPYTSSDANGAERVTVTVFGLVTIADLNRREVRKAAYELLLDLETVLADLIRRRFGDPGEWIGGLSEESQVRVLGNAELLKRRGIETDFLEAVMLPDLLKIVEKSDALRSITGVAKKQLHSASYKIGQMRNRVMHPVRPLVTGQDDVVEMLKAATAARDLLTAVRRVVE